MLMDATSELTPKNKFYLAALKNYIWEAYHLDSPKKDLTTKLFLKPGKTIKIKGIVKTNEDGILAGIDESKWFLEKAGIKILDSKKDGAQIKKGARVLEVEGSMEKILTTERTLLNLIQRMSGIATKTKRMAEKISPHIKLLATRKTLWGPLDKKAVGIGGGGTHRLNLADAILIKDNHLMMHKSFEEILDLVSKKISKIRFAEIELESEKQIKYFLSAYKKIKAPDLRFKNKLVIMLDNFSPVKIKKWLESFKKLDLPIELSGGINENNIVDYNIAGITALSSSAMTMNAPHLDFSLEIHLK